MKLRPTRKQRIIKNSIFAIAAGIFLLIGISSFVWYFWPSQGRQPLKFSTTVAGINGEFGEPFGVAVKGSETYLSDGQNGTIMVVRDGKPSVFASGLGTPSAIAFDKNGNLIVADSGMHTIKSVNAKGEATVLAGVAGKPGFADGDATNALFHAPIGLVIGSDGKIYVSDTYNDRIRVIADGKVTTLTGSSRGFADGTGAAARFDTPTGLAMWHDKLLVADTGNHRIRMVEPNGNTATLAGNGEGDAKDGLLFEASFYQPAAIAVDTYGSIFVADGHVIRLIDGDVIPTVRTISSGRRGFGDGEIGVARFNRPSGLAVDDAGNVLVADSENRLLRRLAVSAPRQDVSATFAEKLKDKPEDFRTLQPPRWPYDPPSTKRDIAGTLGELRGEISPGNDDIHFHNGLDIAGSYGETARFVRDEKVLLPLATQNFGTLRELIRMPTMGYIHIRLGRNAGGVPFGDPRFVFTNDAAGKMADIRVPRGSAFKAGEAIGTLNPMNHVHLIAGRSGQEMNALDALVFPGISDSRPPVIENVTIADESGREIETKSQKGRIHLAGKVRVIMRAYDQVDGNADRRRLGIYKAGYQVLHSDGTPVGETQWTIKFDRMPLSAAVPFVYAVGSKSGATGETIFRYIVTNRIEGDNYREDFLDASALVNGDYILRVFAADYFGNTAAKDIEFSR